MLLFPLWNFRILENTLIAISKTKCESKFCPLVIQFINFLFMTKFTLLSTFRRIIWSNSSWEAPVKAGMMTWRHKSCLLNLVSSINCADLMLPYKCVLPMLMNLLCLISKARCNRKSKMTKKLSWHGISCKQDLGCLETAFVCVCLILFVCWHRVGLLWECCGTS